MDSFIRGFLAAATGALIGAIAISAKLWPQDSQLSILILPPACWAANEFLIIWQLSSEKGAKNAVLHYIALVVASYVAFGWLLSPSYVQNPQVAVFAITLLAPAAWSLAFNAYDAARSEPQSTKKTEKGE